MSHVFVSYAHEDVDFAELLLTKLEIANLSVWRDNEALRAGDDWKQEIDKAISRSFALILIVTNDSSKSVYVMYEWILALSKNVPIIPVFREKIELHPRLGESHGLDFTSRLHRPWSNLIEQLREKKTRYTENSDDLLVAISQASKTINSYNINDRKEAIETLQEIKHPKAIEELAKATKSYIKGARYLAAISLAKVTECSDIRAAPVFIEMLNDQSVSDDDESKRIARENLEHMKYSISVPDLIANLRKSDLILVDAAVELLGRRNDNFAITSICDLLVKDSHAITKYSAAKALEKSRSVISIAYLERALQDTSYDNRAYGRVCDMAAQALVSINTPESISIVEKWLLSTITNDSLQDEIRYLAANALEKIGSERSMKAVKKWKIDLTRESVSLNEDYNFDDASDFLS